MHFPFLSFSVYKVANLFIKMRVRTFLQLCPYQDHGCDPTWIRQQLFLATDLELSEVTLQWSNVLMTHDLLNEVMSKSRYNHTSFDPYNPQCMARQFSLVQGISLPCESFAKFDEKANLFANELADWEISSNEKIDNFHFEKFRVAPSATQNLSHGGRQCSRSY